MVARRAGWLFGTFSLFFSAQYSEMMATYFFFLFLFSGLNPKLSSLLVVNSSYSLETLTAQFFLSVAPETWRKKLGGRLQPHILHSFCFHGDYVEISLLCLKTLAGWYVPRYSQESFIVTMIVSFMLCLYQKENKLQLHPTSSAQLASCAIQTYGCVHSI